MVNIRQKFREMIEAERKKAIEDKKNQIEKLKSEIDSMEK